MSIGDNIKKRRLELGMSVDELAKKIGINRATIYRYESKELENLTINTLEPLAAALQTTPGALLGLKSENQTTDEALKLYFKATPEQKQEIANYIQYVISRK